MSKRKRKVRRKQPSLRRRDVDTFLACQEMDRAAEYLSRGRIYRGLTDEQLADEWIAAFKGMAEIPADQSRKAIEDELRAEFKLRKVKPPFRKVKSDLDRLTSSIASSIEAMQRDDPERFAKINRDLERDIADLKARIKKSN
jgi:hypothetical protein